MPELIDLPVFSDERGDLTVIEKILPFTIKRVFYIYNPNNLSRGGHRHHKTIQAAICVAGNCEILTNNGETKEDFSLDDPSKCLILLPKDWHVMHSFSEDAVLVVLASEFYDVNDYIDEEYK